MKAIQLQAPGSFAEITIADAAAPGPGEALVRVHRVAICGTDVSGYLGKMPFFSYPRIPGHELGVEVLAVGDGVRGVAPGDLCAVEPYINCQDCVACRKGRPNCCTRLTVLGVHVDGGLRPEFVVPARKLHRAESATPDQLALVETLAIGCHAVDRGDVQSDQRVLVVGAGPIGLAVVQFARLAGAEVTALDLNPRRLEFARERMGVAHAVEAGGDVESQFAEITAGDLFDVVIDATGHAGSMAASLAWVGHAGRLVYVGISTEEIVFPHPQLHAREATLLASRNAMPSDFARILELVEGGRIDTRPWITHRSGFEDFIAGFDAWTRPETGVVKAIVEVS